MIINRCKKRITAPETGGAWPIIGHLHHLGGPEPAHRVFAKMADKYGPIFTIQMGVHQTLVVNNWENAKECLSGTNDKCRKIAKLELLSNNRLEKLKHVRETELETSLKELYNKISPTNKVSVEMKRWFEDRTLNVILRIIIGKRWSTSQEGHEGGTGWKEELKKYFEWGGLFLVSDALPFLRWFDIGGAEKLMKKTTKELDIVVQEWLEEHKRKRVVKGEEEDFMDVMLSILPNFAKQFPDHDADTIIRATCLNLILGATDTTSVTLTWALSLLLNHSNVLKKAQNELDIHVGSKRQVKESDLKNLVYLQAILKEAMRLYPAAPLSVPHESNEDCTISGYHVPKGTRLLVNLWKIHRDPSVWSEPCEFRPERFLTTHKDFHVRGHNFEYMPFSGGRRMCPGVSFGLQVAQLTLASLLHAFDLETPFDETVDMREGMGLIINKISPLHVLLSPRFSASVYGA
ncbi:hypothetical protein Ddye_015565 [Dipteronia dyeriana]|uniref:Cytochrome P450 n=1 Tax=Dipteronia dyeriana TaxID=168575 RepID=A0AAD9WYL9_9ROSI|nr:hypothetical protein Ddye_015565 [Dipteronia dyeriana]